MTRTLRCLSLLAGLALLAPAWADMTLIGRSGLIAMNKPNIGQEALYLKKNHLRRDFTSRGRTYSYIYDLERREFAVVDHLLTRVEVYALSNVSVEGQGKADDLNLELTASGEKHPLQHWDCEMHTLEASQPAMLGPEKVTLLLRGQVWMARKAPEKKQLAPFLRAIEAENFFMGTPGQTGSAPAQTEGVNEVVRRILSKGMICAGEIDIQYLGNGPMASLGRRLATRMKIVWETISDAPIDDAAFIIPKGYEIIRR